MLDKLTTNISRPEIKCKCDKCDCDTIDYKIVEIWQDVCDHFVHLHRGEKAILSIGSGCRCVQHNRDVGGSPNSQHLYFRAIDGSLIIKQTDGVYIEIPSIDIYNYVDAKYPNSLGLGCYPTFVHIDSRSTKARW